MFNLVFNPYTTEVHREYVAVAGHGAWLAVLLPCQQTITETVRARAMKYGEWICNDE